MTALKGWNNENDPTFWIVLTIAEHGGLPVEVTRGLTGRHPEDSAAVRRTTLAEALGADSWATSHGTAWGNVRLLLESGEEIHKGEHDYTPAHDRVMVSLDEHGRPCVEVLTWRGEYDRETVV